MLPKAEYPNIFLRSKILLMSKIIDWDSRIGRRLRLRDLHVFFTVVQTGSLAKAAATLHVSQPAVSQLIIDLEHAVGAKLFDRGSRGVTPTVYGRALLARGKAAFDELRQGIQEILRHLGEWLLTKTGHDIEQRYFEIGGRRASQGVDLSDFCWSYHRRSLRTHLHAKQACAILGKQACSMASKPMIVLRLRSFDSRRGSCGSPAKEKVPNRACLKAGRENPPLAAFMGLPVAE